MCRRMKTETIKPKEKMKTNTCKLVPTARNPTLFVVAWGTLSLVACTKLVGLPVLGRNFVKIVAHISE